MCGLICERAHAHLSARVFAAQVLAAQVLAAQVLAAQVLAAQVLAAHGAPLPKAPGFERLQPNRARVRASAAAQPLLRRMRRARLRSRGDVRTLSTGTYACRSASQHFRHNKKKTAPTSMTSVVLFHFERAFLSIHRGLSSAIQESILPLSEEDHPISPSRVHVQCDLEAPEATEMETFDDGCTRDADRSF
jgi:hypothetical protein